MFFGGYSIKFVVARPPQTSAGAPMWLPDLSGIKKLDALLVVAEPFMGSQNTCGK